MPKVEITKLIEAGAHFGHLTRRWNPKMKSYIFMEKNGIHIIDLKKTQDAIEVAANALTNVVSHGKGVLFVGTKKQAQGTIAAEAKRCDSNWVSERWLGGMLTNFQTIRKSIKRLQNIDKMETDGTFEKITKKERLTLSRERDKLRRILDGVETMGRLPGAIFLVDIKKESIAVQEAHRLNIPTFAMVDTNCDPDEVDYVIPANDDASRTIELITSIMADAVAEGQAKAKELKAHESAEKEKEKKIKEEKEEADGSKSSKRVRKVRLDGKSGQRKPRKHSRHEDESKQQTEAASAKEEPVKTEPKKDVVEEKKDKDETEKNKDRKNGY